MTEHSIDISNQIEVLRKEMSTELDKVGKRDYVKLSELRDSCFNLFDKLTECWYNKEYFYKEINTAIINHEPFDELEHGKILISLINSIDKEGYKFLDIGTGGGLSNTIVKKSKFIGCDLPDVIDNVFLVNQPSLDYIKCDITKDDLSFISGMDVVLLNAVLDILKQPLKVLGNILSQNPKYVIIHRQEIYDEPLNEKGVYYSKDLSYGGWTYRTIISEKELKKIINFHKYYIMKEVNSGLGLKYNRSLILRKL